MKTVPSSMAWPAILTGVRAEFLGPKRERGRHARFLSAAVIVAIFGFCATVKGQAPPTLAPEDATPTTNTDVSSFIATGCGYDAWTGSARRVVHDIFPVAGSIGAGGLKLDRTYSSHNNALEQEDSPRAPGQQYAAARLSYCWSMRGRDGLNSSTDLYVVHFPDGRVEGFHSPENSGITGETAWRSGLGTKERLKFSGPPPGTADLYLEDGSVVHFGYETDFIEQTPPGDHIHPLNYLLDIFTPTGVTDPQGLLTRFTMEQIPGTFEIYDKRLKTVTDPGGQTLTYSYDAYGGITQIAASDGQWVGYSPSYQDAATVTYSDGTSASYTYDVITTIDPDTGDPGAPVLVWSTAQDTRAEGPMQSIQYTYRSNPPPKFGGQIISEQHYPNGIIPVSTFTSDDLRTTATDTRGDGPARTLFMSKSGKTPLLRWKNDFNGIPEYFYYDSHNYLTQFTDRRNVSTLYAVERFLGQPTTITHPDALDGNGPTTEVYTYSFQGAADTSDPYFVASITNDRGYTTYYDRDSSNRIVTIRYPDNATETFTYDVRSRVTMHKRKNGFYDFADYDGNGKLLKLWSPVPSPTNPQSQPSTTFTYYPTGNPWAGRLKDMTDPLGHKTTYEYDLSFDPQSLGQPCSGRGLVTKITHNVDSTYKAFGYDQFGNKVSETDETNRTTHFSYDGYNRLQTVALPGQAPTSYDYTPTGGGSPFSHTTKSATLEISPSGVQTVRAFDANLRLVAETEAAGTSAAATTSYDYDQNGNRTGLTDPRGNAGYSGDYTTVTAYDSRNRKISAASPGL